MKTGAKWLLFFFILMFVAQIIRANVPAQTMTITEMPIKKYFTLHRSAYARYAFMTKRTEYREVKLRQIENGNFLPFGHSSVSEFVACITPNGANVRLKIEAYKGLFFK